MAKVKSSGGVKTKIRELRWPELGVVRRQGTEGQPNQPGQPFPTPWAINCRLQDPLDKRLRGGSRSGLSAWSGDLAGRMLGPGVSSTWLGYAPSGCTHGCWYRDRLVAGGGDNAIYLARQGNHTDWDFGVDVGDTGRATVFQLGEARETGGTATAFMPFQDRSLLAATSNSLWLVQGDPAASGTLRNLSRGVGVIGSQAWCEVQDGRVGDTPVGHAFVFLSSLGLFMISASGDGLQSLSEDRVPKELLNLPGTNTVSLAYSPQERGIYVFVTPASGAGTHWFFDLVHQGFWPMVLPTNYQPTAAGWLDDDLVLNCKDSTLRKIGGSDDHGTNIESYVLIGPLRLSGADLFGTLTRIEGVLPTGSASVGWRIITGNTAAEACANGEAAITAYLAGQTATAEAYAKASGTWQAGRALTRYPRVRAMWVCVLLKATSAWAYESIVVHSRDAGSWR